MNLTEVFEKEAPSFISENLMWKLRNGRNSRRVKFDGEDGNAAQRFYEHVSGLGSLGYKKRDLERSFLRFIYRRK